MSIVPSESANEQEISNSISRFVCDFKIGSLLKRCNCKKQKGVPIMRLFTYILCSVFRDRSMHMQKKTGNFKEDFSKNAYYRFFAVPIPTGCVLLRYSLKRSSMSICVDLLLNDRVDCFVVDDYLYERIGYKHTELASKVFDHVSMKFKKGFRMMTHGWIDGCSFYPDQFFVSV